MRDLFKLASGFTTPAIPLRIRFCQIVSVQNDRTVTITVGGSSQQITGVHYLESVEPKPGTPAIVATDGTDLFIVGHISAANMTIAPRVHRTGDQTIASGGEVAVTWQAVDNDDWGFWSGTNATRLTAQVPGRYIATASAAWAVNATGVRGAFIRDGSGTLLGSSVIGAFNDFAHHSVVTPAFNLDVGDYIQLFVQQTSGGNLALVRYATFQPAMSLIYLG